MCKILQREGREWALDSVRQMQRLVLKGNKFRQLINYLERGLAGRPKSFAEGVQSVIDELKQIGEAA